MIWALSQKIFSLAMVLVILGVGSAQASAEAAVGEVIFVAGEVRAVSPQRSRVVAQTDPVYVGDRLVTAEDGYVHVRFVDGGLVSVRPDSAVRIDTYEFDADDPAASRVRIVLEEGAVRSATGKAGQASKDRFRINTPVSAIGIRGTDFVVFADESLARLSVHSGGVVMAPFGEGCVAAAFGPCEQGAAELFASLSRALLEVRADTGFALVTSDVPSPDELRPPHPEEAVVFDSAINGVERALRIRTGISAEGAKSYEDGLERVARFLDEQSRDGLSLMDQATLSAQQGGGVIKPRDRGLVEDPQIIWGRWSAPRLNSAEYRKDMAERSQDRRYVLLNSVFALLEYPHQTRPLPETGRVSFELNSYEAYVKRGVRLEEASISNAGLVVDFEQSSFATHLDLHADSVDGVVPIVGIGELNDKGFFYSNGDSPAEISGVLSPNADEAGMLFEYQISPGVDAVGATHWVNGER